MVVKRSKEGQGRSKKDVRKVLQYEISEWDKRRSKKDVKKCYYVKCKGSVREGLGKLQGRSREGLGKV